MMIGNFSYGDPQNIPEIITGGPSKLHMVSTGNILVLGNGVKKIHDATPIRQFRWFCHRPIGKI